MHSFYKEKDQSFWVQIMHLWDLEFGALFVAGSPRVYDGIKPFWWKVKNSICFSFVWWGSWHTSTGTRSGMIVQRKMICLLSTWNTGQAGRVPVALHLRSLLPPCWDVWNDESGQSVQLCRLIYHKPQWTPIHLAWELSASLTTRQVPLTQSPSAHIISSCVMLTLIPLLFITGNQSLCIVLCILFHYVVIYVHALITYIFVIGRHFVCTLSNWLIT